MSEFRSIQKAIGAAASEIRSLHMHPGTAQWNFRFVRVLVHTVVMIALGGAMAKLVIFGDPEIFASHRGRIIAAALIDGHLLDVYAETPCAWTSQAEQLSSWARTRSKSPQLPSRPTAPGLYTKGASSFSPRVMANGYSALTEVTLHRAVDGSTEQLALVCGFLARPF